MGDRSEVIGAEAAMRRLMRARIPAVDKRRELNGQLRYLDSHLAHLTDVAARFARRRDHLLAAVEGHREDTEPAAELAETAERLRNDAEKARSEVAEVRAATKERQRSAVQIVSKIDAAAERLTEALNGLEQIRIERENKERLRELKSGYRQRLQTLDRNVSDLSPAEPGAVPASAAWDLEGRVRDATRLTYEAQALVELRREGTR